MPVIRALAAGGTAGSLCARRVHRRRRRRPRARPPTSSGAHTARTRSRPRSPAARSPARRPIAAASAPASPAGTSPSRSTSSGSAPTRLATTGTPAAIASAAASPKVSAERDGASAIAAPARSAGELRRPRRGRGTHVLRLARARSAPARALAGDHERHARHPAGIDRDVHTLLGRQPRDDQRIRALGGPMSAQTAAPHRRGASTLHALPWQRRAERAQALARERARHDHLIGLRDQTPLPQRQRGAIGCRLGQVAATVQAHARQRVCDRGSACIPRRA